ncbi:hypothetical protein P9112_012145 [Eukaryota sp. TZLM1-RC]
METLHQLSFVKLRQTFPNLPENVAHNVANLLSRLFFGKIDKNSFIGSLTSLVPELYQTITSPQFLAPLQKAVTKLTTGRHPFADAFTWEPSLPVFSLQSSQLTRPPIHSQPLFDLFRHFCGHFMPSPDCLPFLVAALDDIVLYLLKTLVFANRQRSDVFKPKLPYESQSIFTTDNNNTHVEPLLSIIAESEQALRDEAARYQESREEDLHQRQVKAARDADDKEAEKALQEKREKELEARKQEEKLRAADAAAASYLGKPKRGNLEKEASRGRVQGSLATSGSEIKNIDLYDWNFVAKNEKCIALKKLFH